MSIRKLGLIVFVVVGTAIIITAVPNMLSRGNNNETAAMGNLRALGYSLEIYRSAHRYYPDEWLADMYTNQDPDFGPPSFGSDIQSRLQTVQGYDYRYTSLPMGCAEPSCTQYALTATPHIPGKTGIRAFFTSESGGIHHCNGERADARDALIDRPPHRCRSPKSK